MPFDWSEAAILRLKELFEAGESDAGIARKLSNEFEARLSRSSVIGKRHRLDMVVSEVVVVKRKSNGHDSRAMPSGVNRAPYPKRGPHHEKATKIDKSVWTKPERAPQLPRVTHSISAQVQAGVPVSRFKLDIPGLECKGVALDDLRSDQCRWPLDAGGSCGRAKSVNPPHQSYCPHHAALSRKPIQQTAPRRPYR